MAMFEVTSISVGGKSCNDWFDAAREFTTQMTKGVNDAVIDTGVAMELFMTRVKSNLLERHGGNWPLSGNDFGTDPNRLAMRSGKGLDSVFKSARVDISNNRNAVTGQISTANLTVHETGATITPKNGQFLAIPLRAALNSSGIPLKTGPRRWTNTFVRRSKAGNLLIFRKERGGVITPLYLLRTSVVIPPRLRLAETIDANLGYFQSKMLDAFEKEFT